MILLPARYFTSLSLDIHRRLAIDLPHGWKRAQRRERGENSERQVQAGKRKVERRACAHVRLRRAITIPTFFPVTWKTQARLPVTRGTIMAKTTIEFSDNAASELDKIARDHSTSKADVIRNALALYGFLLAELKSAEHELAILKNDEIEKIVAVPGILRTMPRAMAARAGA
jgi:predicted transcriptional regulator